MIAKSEQKTKRFSQKGPFVFFEKDWDKKGNDRLVIIDIKPKRGGIADLYCEICDSKSCYHVNFAWGIPEIREILEKYNHEDLNNDRNY